MNHFGRLAARVMRPNARQPGPALRSDSPIAEHDQRLTSFSVVPMFGHAHDAARSARLRDEQEAEALADRERQGFVRRIPRHTAYRMRQQRGEK